MPNNQSLKQQVFETLLASNCIVLEPNIGRDGFIAPTFPSGKQALNNASFLQLYPKAALAVLGGLKNIDIVVGIELSGIGPAALVAYALGKPFGYVRKKPKDYGLRKLIQGDVSNKQVLLVDDFIFYGQTKNEAVEKIKQAGGNVVGLFVVFTVDPVSAKWSKECGIPIYRLFDREEIYQAASNKGLISQALCDLERKIYNRKDYRFWHTDPKLWQEFVAIMLRGYK